ncbi:MAG: metalloregulator ArsR/SmtB family transcription factor [Planctomycetota bacterium]
MAESDPTTAKTSPEADASLHPDASQADIDQPGCDGGDHSGLPITIDAEACERAASIFRALGDPQRLRILMLLEASERCVSEVCELLDEPMPAISQRLRLLRSERIVRSRRVGKHVFYSLADDHISRLVTNGVMHAMEM